MDYEELEQECTRNKMYTKRVMDLWCDAKKWHYLAEHSENDAVRNKYMAVSNSLMDLFNNEINEMRNR